MITTKKRHSRNSNTSQGDNKSTSETGIQHTTAAAAAAAVVVEK